MPVTYTFANATSAIPLSQLDTNFATPITIGNTAVQLGNTISTVNNLTLVNATVTSVSTPITAAQGGTGLATLTANNVLIGNGTGSVTFVAPGTNGNVLASNGTAWVSTAAASSGFPITLGNTSIAASSTTTTVGNLTINNATIGSGTVNASTVTSTTTMSASGNAYMTIATLTDGATITPNFGANNNFTVTLGGNRTLANATNLTAGQSGVIYVVQDATGGRTLSYGTIWKFPSNTAPTLSTAANAVDALFYCVRSNVSITVNSVLNVA